MDSSKAIELKPEFAKAWYGRGFVRHEKGDRDAAFADLTKAVELDPADAVAWYARGLVQSDRGQVEAAIADFTKAIELDATKGFYWHARAALRYRREDFDGALSDADRAVQCSPRDHESLKNRAACLLAKGEWPKAASDLKLALEVAPRDWKGRGEAETLFEVTREQASAEALKKGKSLESKEDYDGAMAAYTQAVEFDPTSLNAWLARGILRLNRRDYDGALDDLNRAVALNPNQAIPLGYRARARKEHEDLKDAIEDCRKAIELDPTQTWIRIDLGNLYIEKKEFDAAIECFSKAIEVDPKNRLSLLLMALAKRRKGDFDGALADLARMEKEEPGSCLTAYLRACCRLARRQWDDARADFARALDGMPKDWDFRESAEALSGAIDELSKIDASLPPSQRLLEVARARIAAGDTERAMPLLREAIELDYRDVDVLETSALACFSLHHRVEALKRVFDILDLGKPLGPKLLGILRSHSTAVLGGLLWLGDHPMPDGRWSATAFGDVCRKDRGGPCGGKARTDSDLRATGLVLLAWNGAGYSHLSKELYYPDRIIGEVIKDGLQWLIARQEADGGFGQRRLEDGAIAAFALIEAYGTTGAKILTEPAQKAAEWLVAKRLPGAGWAAKEKGREPDLTTTAWALFALRGARMSEIEVPATAFDEPLEDLLKRGLLEKANPADSSWALAVAAISLFRPSIPALSDCRTAIESAGAPVQGDALGTLGSAILLHSGGTGGSWKSWNEQTRKQLVKGCVGNRDGEWICSSGSWDVTAGADSDQGRLVTTALHVLTLEICYGYRNSPFLPLPVGK